MAIKDHKNRVQVILRWGRSPLDVFQFACQPGTIRVGSDRECDIRLPQGIMPQRSYPLLEIGEKGLGVRKFQGLRVTRRDDCLSLGVGQVELLISRVPVHPAHRALPQDQETTLIKSFVLSLMLVAAFISTLLVTEVDHPEEHLVRLNRASGFSGDFWGIAPNARGSDGKAGRPGTPDVNRLMSRMAAYRSDRESLTRPGALRPAGKAEFLPGSFNTSGNGLGGERHDAMGGLSGTQPGESGGASGLSVKGTGTGGSYWTGSYSMDHFRRRIPCIPSCVYFVAAGILKLRDSENLTASLKVVCETHDPAPHLRGSWILVEGLDDRLDVSLWLETGHDSLVLIKLDLRCDRYRLKWVGEKRMFTPKKTTGLSYAGTVTSTFEKCYNYNPIDLTISLHCENFHRTTRSFGTRSFGFFRYIQE